MRRRVGLIALLAVLVTVACSDGGGPSQEVVVESQLEEIMTVVVPLLEELNPYNVPPLAASVDPALGEEPCAPIPESDQLCISGGSIEQCGEAEFNFLDCFASLPALGSLTVSGTLTYSPDWDWPAGQRLLDIASSDGAFLYSFDFDFTELATVLVTSDAVDALCSANLETGLAECQLA